MSNNSSKVRLDITVPDDYVHMKELAEKDLQFLVKKDQTYGGSWRKRGGVGAFMMLARKWDRIENFAREHTSRYDIFDLIINSDDPEDILDDLKDLRNYLLLTESYVRKCLEEGSGDEIQVVHGRDGRLTERRIETSDYNRPVISPDVLCTGFKFDRPDYPLNPDED